MIISQILGECWDELIGDPNLATVMLDRFIPYARGLQLMCDSRRGKRGK